MSATKSPPDDKEERQEEGEQDEEENTAGAATVVAAKQTAEAMGATQKRKGESRLSLFFSHFFHSSLAVQMSSHCSHFITVQRKCE